MPTGVLPHTALNMQLSFNGVMPSRKAMRNLLLTSTAMAFATGALLSTDGCSSSPQPVAVRLAH
jgi:hypothetical protein